MTRQEFFEMKAAGALWDVGVSINRTNPLPLDKNAVFASYDEALTYAQGVLSYPGQFIAVVAEDNSVTGYIITVAGGAGATLQKLAAQTATGDVVADLAALTTRVGNLETSVDGIKTEIGAKAVGETAATGIYKYVDDKVAAATPEGYAGVKADVTKLVGTDKGEDGRANKTVREIASEEVAKIVNGAPEAYDTLKEVSDWISTHGTDAATMNTQINANKAAIEKLNGTAETVGSVTNTVNAAIDGALKVDGKDKYALATDLMTANGKITALETKTAGLTDAEGADMTVKAYVDAGDAKVDAKVTALSTRVDNLGKLAAKDEVAEADLAAALKTKIDGKADKATTLAGYGIEDAYTKTGAEGMVDGKIEALALGTMSKEKASDYTKTADLETALAGKYDAAGAAKAVDDKLPAMNAAISANTEAITTLNGAASVEGSVAKKIQTAITELDLANTYAAKTHTHAMEQVTGLANEFAKYQLKGDYALKSEVTAVDQKATDLATLVGTLPEGATATTVVGYAKEVADKAAGDAAAVGAKVDTLVGEDAGKSARTIANEELAKQLIPESAQESLDTLKEIADWIQAHPAEVTEMNSKITALEGKAHEHTNKAVLDGITAEKVTSWDSALHAGDIPAATAEVLGLVKVDNTSIESNNGVIGIKAVNVQKLFVAEGDEFILDGGKA